MLVPLHNSNKDDFHLLDPVVPSEKIEERYYRTLELLKEAISYTYRTFVFDNSQNTSEFILDVYKGKEVTCLVEKIPIWVDKYYLNL